MGHGNVLGIGGMQNAAEDAWFVVDKDLDNNILIVAQGHNHPRMLHNTLECKQLDWVDPESMTFPMNCSAKNRYRQADQKCKIEQIGDDHFKVNFTEKQRAITPGQSVVFYQEEVCLGGGMVKVLMNGRHELRKVELDDSLMSDDKEMIEDLVAAAVNDAVRKIEQQSSEKMSGVTAGMDLPGGMKLPF